MLNKIREGCFGLMYLTAVSDTLKFITELEESGHKPKEIIKHLKTSGRSADLAIDNMLGDMEAKMLRVSNGPMQQENS